MDGIGREVARAQWRASEFYAGLNRVRTRSRVQHRLGRLGILLLFGGVFACMLPGAAFAQATHKKFRVASYNVRTIVSEDTGDYRWSGRKAGVFAMIRQGRPDVFGIQEAGVAPEYEIFHDLKAEFSDEYGVMIPQGYKSRAVPIFFRKSRFEQMSPPQQGTIMLEVPYAESHSCYAKANNRRIQWIKLRDKDSGRVYLFMNTHTSHGKDCWDARNKMADKVHAFLSDSAHADSTAVLMGDLNVDQQRSPALDTAANDKLPALLEQNKSTHRLRRSERHSGKTNADSATFNHAWKSASSTHARIDYIFVNSLDATTAAQAIDRNTINDLLGSGPNITPSDHFFVRAEVRQAPFKHSAATSTTEGGIAQDHISFGDVNGDGRVDLIRWKTLQHEGKVRVHLAQADGKFAPAPIIDDNPGLDGEWRYFADIDGDGCADRISWKPGQHGGAIRVGKSNCDGSFQSSETHSPGSTQGGTKLFFGRLNDDECFDRIAWHPDASGGKTRVALAKCDGSLEFHPEIVNEDAGKTTNAGALVSFADINGDGLADKIVWDLNQFSGRSVVYKSNGDGTFSHFQEHPGGSSSVATTRMYFGDVNGDGFAEKTFWRPTFREGYMQLHDGSEDGLESPFTVVNSGPSTDEKTAYHLADINGDGSDDLIRWNLDGDPNQIEVYLALVTTDRSEPQDPEPPEDPDSPREPDDPNHPQDPSQPDMDAGNLDADYLDIGGNDRDSDDNIHHPGQGDIGSDDSPDDGSARGTSDEMTGGCGCASGGGQVPGELFIYCLGLGIWFGRRRARRA